MATIEVKVPDIGDFKDIPVIEVFVKPGDTLKKDDSIVTLESDKATMEVPASDTGTVKEVRVKLGDKVSEGTVLLVLETAAAGAQPKTAQPNPEPKAEAKPEGKAAGLREALSSTLASLDADIHAEVLVLGAGPGGYTAAFRAADLGKKVVLVERYATLGGVCLNVGCIPSKALLHAARVIADADEMSHFGVAFGAPKTDLAKLRGWKESVVSKLTKGLAGLAKGRKVTVLEGTAQFASPHTLEVQGKEGRKVVSFDHCIIAAGSQSARIPGIPYDDPRLMDSTGRARAEGHPEAAPHHRRRHHRPGDGDRVRRARRQGHGGGVHGPPDPRRGSGHREAAGAPHREALREDPAEDQGGEDRGAARRVARDLRERGRRHGGARARSLRPGARRRGAPAQRAQHRCGQGGHHRQRARMDPGGPPDAHQREPHLRHRRHRRRADARAQGDARGQARGRGDRRDEPPRVGSAHHPERRLHRSGSAPGWAFRSRRPRRRASSTRRPCSPGRRAAARSAWGARKA
jgi:pyruvate/2-oxoglutarate dehydrogenase complex dihydrolipoamide acyltransferase (E2) component